MIIDTEGLLYGGLLFSASNDGEEEVSFLDSKREGKWMTHHTRGLAPCTQQCQGPCVHSSSMRCTQAQL